MIPYLFCLEALLSNKNNLCTEIFREMKMTTPPLRFYDWAVVVKLSPNYEIKQFYKCTIRQFCLLTAAPTRELLVIISEGRSACSEILDFCSRPSPWGEAKWLPREEAIVRFEMNLENRKHWSCRILKFDTCTVVVVTVCKDWHFNLRYVHDNVFFLLHIAIGNKTLESRFN